MKDFLQEWASVLSEIEQILEQVLPSADTYPQVLHKAMRYSTLGGGKRLRALLVMGACAAVGGCAADGRACRRCGDDPRLFADPR